MYLTNTKTNFHPCNNNNYNSYNPYQGNYGTQQYYPYDISVKNDMNNMYVNPFYENTACSSQNMSNNFNHNNNLFEKNVIVNNKKNNQCDTIKSKIKNKDNFSSIHNMEIDDDTENNYDLYYEDEEGFDESRGEENTIINITYGDQSSECDCSEYNDQNIHKLQKPKKPRKKFMGKYVFSEIKDSLLTNLRVCAPHPILVPNTNCFYYNLTDKTKGRKNRKPEIIVRY